MIRVRVPATTANLGPGLDVLGMALDLHSVVEIATADADVTVTYDGAGEAEVSLGADNLVVRAAEALFTRQGVRPDGYRLAIHNPIPLARGLGSSAAAIVGGIVAANRLVAELAGPTAAASTDELLALATALEGHPDNVAPALLGGVTVAVQDEERVHVHSFQPPARLRLVVAIPEFPLSTMKAREAMPEQVTLGDAVFNVGRASLLVTALLSGRFDLLAVACDDRLHQPYRSRLVPGLAEVVAAARAAGAAAAFLSGAGPSVIALIEGGKQTPGKVGRAMTDAFLSHGVHARTLVAGAARYGAATAP